MCGPLPLSQYRPVDAAEETIGDTAAELLAVRADAAVASELLATRNAELERERASREEAEALKVLGCPGDLGGMGGGGAEEGPEEGV